jgi:hypothetical protein
MAAQDEPAIEAQEKVLPDGLHPIQPPAIELLRKTFHRRARMRRLHLDALADEHV